MAKYNGKVIRTLPFAMRTETPKPDEVVISSSKHSCLRQLTIEARYLKPKKAVIDSEAVVIEGPKHGAIGKVGGLTDQICTVRFDDVKGAEVRHFKLDKLAYVEALRNPKA